MATTSNNVEQQAVTPAQQNKSTQPSVLLPTGAAPDTQNAVTPEFGEIITVGTVGKITVCYNSDLGAPGLTQAQQFLTRALSPYNDMEVIFGIAGGAVTVRICAFSAAHDGTGGGSHFGCDFVTGGTLFLDATFGNTTVNPLDLLLAIYVAELSESFMGPQGLGWGCMLSNGEGLSRFLAEQETSVATLAAFATVQAWHESGAPDWVNQNAGTDRNQIANGCAVAYLYYMRWLGYTIPKIVQAGGTTLAVNFKNVTGNTTANAYLEMRQALTGLFITSDNPFPTRLLKGQLLFYRDKTRNGTGDVSHPSLIGKNSPFELDTVPSWHRFTHIFSNGNGGIYAVNPEGQLQFFFDELRNGLDDVDVKAPVIIGQSGWQNMKFVFSGGPGIIYAVNQQGQLLFYPTDTQGGTADLGTPSVIGLGGWQGFTQLFSGGNGIIYAVNTQGQLLFYRDHTRNGTGDVDTPSVIGQGGWQGFTQLFSGGNGIIYAVNAQGQLLFYQDHTQNGTGDINTPSVIGLGGWQNMKFVFDGGQGIIYAVPNVDVTL
jgi:hypothetical protein